ncbi:Uncharacterised protein [Aeromonas salmonicida]|uniref:hypothetical protein n=1 Tax=Aeromonas salmonicida TaxID=645 RepID=UPI001026D1CF|nr:hypothetical protein [Aeromonas salmonicida]VFB09635.1 Uncharacterised protein [Aeromonas salmonicida]
MKLKYTLLASALISMSSFYVAAADGGQASVPVNVAFTGLDQCVPQAVTAQSISISADDITNIPSRPAMMIRPVIKTQTFNLTLSNCPVGKVVKLMPGATAVSETGLSPLTGNFQPIYTGQQSIAATWGFSGAAANVLSLALSSRSSSTANANHIDMAFGANVTLDTADTVTLGYSVIAKDLNAARQLRTGSYSSTATLNISVL